jgi:hypothetical protein
MDWALAGRNHRTVCIGTEAALALPQGRVVQKDTWAMETCLYRNCSAQLVILRCIGAEAYFLEKVIFPFEDWCFQAPGDADVELWTHGLGGAELLERFDARTLVQQVNQPADTAVVAA